MANILRKAREVRVFWFWKSDGKINSYKVVEGSLKTNQEENTIRFMLHEIDGFDDDFEVIIRKTKQGVVFRADCYEADSDREYPLKYFDSADETILFCEDKYEVIYFHVK